MTRVLGVDGCRGGWLAVALDLASGALRAELAERWADLPWREARMVALDLPVGLPEQGPRACDLAARKLLPRGRKASVFPAPRRYMLDCPDWQTAQALGRAREGCGLSKQAWNITAKIREVDKCLTPRDQERLREVHPELVFHRLSGQRPVPPKRRPEGQAARLALLRRAGLEGIEPWLDRFPRAAAGRDDVIDAAACVLTAQRILQGKAERLPAEPSRDERGLLMEIWY